MKLEFYVFVYWCVVMKNMYVCEYINVCLEGVEKIFINI